MNAVSFVALALLVAACNSGSASPSASTSPSGSPSPTATASPSASEDLKAVVERVVREYYEEANRALATGDVARLKSLSTDDCSCRRLVRYIEDKYKGGSLRGAVFNVKSIRAYNVEASRAVVQVKHDAPAYDILDNAGNRIERVHADPGNTEDVYVETRGSSWLVRNVVSL